MFCRFCGAHILEDSLFCARCGKRLGRVANPRLEKLARKLRLHTPYPYAGILVVLFLAWALQPHNSTFDYSQTKWSIETDRKIDSTDDDTYRENLSLVVENTGSKTIRGIPIELHARIEPQKTADVSASFPGVHELVIAKGVSRPVVVVLSDAIAGGTKRRYALDESVKAANPYKVTLEVVQNDARTVLTNHILER